MWFVRSLTSGVWRSVDIVTGDGRKLGERILIRPTISDKWCLDHQPVDVEAGVCVSVVSEADAQFFLDDGRAQLVVVEKESVVAFANENDAMHHVRKGFGDRMSAREVQAYLQAVQEARQQAIAEEERLYGEGNENADADGGEQDGETSVSVPAGKVGRGRGRGGRRKAA